MRPALRQRCARLRQALSLHAAARAERSPAAPPSRCRRLGGVLLLLAGLVPAHGTARAQAPLAVEGTLEKQSVAGSRTVARERVTLHRVNARDAGPIDSVLTDAQGRFRFRVVVPDTQSMYLVSARYGGIAYFSQPLQVGPPVSQAEILVYDTTSVDVPLQLQGRHFVVSAPSAEGARSVIDVLEISNDTILTRVPGSANRPTYSLLLPGGARNVRATQGDISDGAVEVRNGRAEIFSPLAPGLRQLVLTYELPAEVFPLAIPLEAPVAVLEVLLEEPGADAATPGLVNQGGVTVDGKTFTRFLGASTANAVLTLTGATGGPGSSVPPWVLPLVLTLITVGAILVLARRRPAAVPARPAPLDAMRTAGARPVAPVGGHGGGRVEAVAVDAATRLAYDVAAVDALLERDPPVPVAARPGLDAYRGRLAQELRDVLAPRTPVQ